MLILTRRTTETIHIGDEVTVTVLGVVGNQVRFGISAPTSIVVDRAEIYEKKKRIAAAREQGIDISDPDEEARVAWWKGLTHDERRAWCSAARSTDKHDAWEHYKRVRNGGNR